MIRTYIIPCDLKRIHADNINLNSGRIYSGIVSRHWRLLKPKGLWLSEKTLTKLSNLRLANKEIEMHAHTIDAAQQGFFKACKTIRALRKVGIEANFPWRSKKFRTTIWKNTAIKFKDFGELRLRRAQTSASSDFGELRLRRAQSSRRVVESSSRRVVESSSRWQA